MWSELSNNFAAKLLNFLIRDKQMKAKRHSFKVALCKDQKELCSVMLRQNNFYILLDPKSWSIVRILCVVMPQTMKHEQDVTTKLLNK